jgi:hypothetical protein
MARIKNVIELLAEQPEEQLKRMRDATKQELARAQAEVQRLSVEAQQIDQALAKRQRDGSRSGRLTAQIVLDALQPGVEVAVSDVARILTGEGYNTTPNAVRNHLIRLADRGELLRVGDRYARVTISSEDDFPSSPRDEDIPF